MEDVRVLVSGLRFPESPCFDSTNCLWCVEQEGQGLFCRDRDGSEMRIHTGGRPNGLVAQGDYIWFCDSGYNAIRRLNIQTRQIETVLDSINGEPLAMPNDLIFDPAGNLIFSCPGPPDGDALGYVAVYDTNGQVEVIADGLDYPNGLAFFPEETSLLIAETHRQRIWEGYWDQHELSWENIRVWATVGDRRAQPQDIPGPDGMTAGPGGRLYVAEFGAGLIRVYNTDGDFVRSIELPGKNPSNCTVDPSGQLGLVVTETEKGQLLSIAL
ncbi:SMP-30/gluconolactonase/LRE family protein [Spirosoma luteolum]